MKISLNWLKEYINISKPVEEIAANLTDCGLEVEGIENFTSFPGGMEGLVVGEVVECIQHPNADRLKLTKVNIGKSENLFIVCGAPNVEKGQKVIVATVGTLLYPKEGECFKIKKSKIRGEVSEGMICAEDEIGYGESHEGIMVLPSDATVGTPISEYFNIVNDTVLEIGLTPNRSDATSHYGVARDLAAVLNLHENVQVNKPSVDDFKVDEKTSKIHVEVKDHNACPRYSGLSFSGVEVKASPDWLQNKLKAIGVKPINNIVDVTNFVLHEIGQPLHAFDADKIAGNKVIVQSLAKNTDFVTLDEKQRKLHEEDLMICNEKGGMCIAGIFGGAETGVTENTKNIFLESAYFNPVSIRKTAKRHGLNTDASFRYERGADPEITIYALKRAALLMKEVAGAKVSSEIIDIYPNKIAPFEVDFNYSNCNKLIGQVIAPETIRKIFKSLEIEILEEDNEGLKVAVPPFKVDVQREVDLIEEVLRIYGYNQIELPDFMKTSLSFSTKKESQKIEDNFANFLSSNGFNEIFNNSLSNPSYYEEKDDLVDILNPLSNELQVMRKTLLYGGLEAIQYNKNRKRENLNFFEFGKVYSLIGDKKYKEQKNLGLWMSGNKSEESWQEKSEEMDFYTLKSIIHSIFIRMGINPTFKIDNISSKIFSLGLQYALGKNVLVEFGMLDQKLLSKNGVKANVFYAEFNWDNILKVAPDKDIQYKAVTKYPSVRRDLALLIDEAITFSRIEEIAYKTERTLLKQVNLFDVYEGSKLPEGKKSYAVSFVFQDEKNTLKDKNIDAIMERLIQRYKDQLGVELR